MLIRSAPSTPTEPAKPYRSAAWPALLPLVLLLAVGLRLFHLDRWSFWPDEMASLLYARLPLGEIWGADTMPPLYYTLLHLWRLAGEGEWWLRLSSALVSTLNVWLAYRLGRRLGGDAIGLWAALFLATAPFSLYHAQELRMYALLECGALVAMLGLANLLAAPARAGHRVLRQGGARCAWALYGGGSLLMLYTHNTGFLLPLAATLMVPFFARRSPFAHATLVNWLTVNLVVVALWAAYWPWLFEQLARVAEDFWVEQPDLGSFLGQMAEIHLGLLAHHASIMRFAWPILAPALLVGLLVALRRWPGWALGLLGLAVIPPAVELLVGLYRPIFLPRTLIWTGVPSVLALAVAADWLGRRRQHRLLALAALAVLLLARAASAIDYYLSEPKADWRGMATVIEEQVPRGEPVIVFPSWQSSPLRFYLEQSAEERGVEARRLLPYKKSEESDARRGLLAMLPAANVWVLVGEGAAMSDDLLALLRELLPCAKAVGRIEHSRLTLHRFDVGPCAEGASP